MRAVRVQAAKPWPTSASVDRVSARTIEDFPDCTLPNIHTMGANERACSAILSSRA